MSEDNLKLWNAVQETNPADTKKVNQRGGFTAIDAYSQIKCATKKFGSYGKGWGMRDMKHTFVPNVKMVMCVATFFYEDSNFEISSAIEYAKGDRNDDDFAKKLETDMITKALSRLGFNSDVFMGKFDDNKYVQAMNKKFEQVDTKPIRQQYVDRAIEVYRECVEADVEEIDTKKMQDVNTLLTNDERIEVMNVLKPLGKMAGTNRAYTTIVNECLKAHPADKEEFFDANLLSGDK